MYEFRATVMAAAALAILATDTLAQTDTETTNRLLVDAITGSNGASDPLYRRRLLSAIAEEFPGSAAAGSIAAGVVSVPGLPDGPDWHQLLIPDSEVTGFRHGAFPSLGRQITHPGIDIGFPGQSDCGVPVLAPLTGEVVRVVSADVSDEDLARTGIDRARNTRDLDDESGIGNAVVLRHETNEGAVFTLYLHLQQAPTDASGTPWRVGMTVGAGQQIGLVGETGAAKGCHLHFEARRFEGRYKYLHPEFNNIYPDGDVSRSAVFVRDWIEPDTFLRRAFIARHLGAGGSVPNADKPETAIADTSSATEGAQSGSESESWIVSYQARRTVQRGETAGDIALLADGSARYRDQPLFPATRNPADTELRLFLSPKAQHGFIVQWDHDGGGLRAGLIDLKARQIVRNDFIPETSIRGLAAPQNVRIFMMPVAWSPDGRYLAFPLSASDWQADPVFADTATGQSHTVLTDDLKPGQWAVPKLDTLAWDGEDRVALSYDILKCADAGCTSPEVAGSIDGTHRISSFGFDTGQSKPERSPQETASAPNDWGPGLVAGVEVGFAPCRDAAKQDEACLKALGLSPEAIAFSFASDKDYSGSSVGNQFRELGAVDLAISQFIGNTVYHTPVLVNGAVGFQIVQYSSDLQQTFRDQTSQTMLRRFPKAGNLGGMAIQSHRQLEDGTQRFTLIEYVIDGCRACAFLGSAVSFLDIGPATGNRLVRRPIGLLLTDPSDPQEKTADVLSKLPDRLQFSLNALGYDAGEMDGFPGPQTRQALMQFQAEHCLPPTGQPDRATAQALAKADGFSAPCAGTPVPDQIDANTPLLNGVYVDDPALCDTDSVPYETAHLQQRIIRENNTTWGVEGLCTTQRTDIRDGVTLFRGTCSEGATSSEGRWRFDVQSNESFVDLDMLAALPQDAAPRRFTRCPEQSALYAAHGFDSAAASGSQPRSEEQASKLDAENPDFGAIVAGLDYLGAAEKAATTDALQTAFILLRGMEPDGTAARLGLSAQDFATQLARDPQGMLAVIGSDVVISAGEAVLAEAAGDLVSGYMFGSGPLSELPDEWRVPLQAFVDATIVEGAGLVRAGTDPSGASVVGPVVDRLHDVHDIYQATNALSRTQATGLFAVANGAEILSQLVEAHPGDRTEALRVDWFASTRANLADIVGKDDAVAAYQITVLGYRALEALARGDQDTARVDIARMRAAGDAEQGLTPLSAEGPIDLLVKLASGGNDAPKVLVETFLRSTALSTLDASADSEPQQDTAEVPESWQTGAAVAAVLRDIARAYPAQTLEGCTQAHGPISVDFRRKLFGDVSMEVVDPQGRRSMKPVTQQMVEGDRFCLNPRVAYCAMHDYQLYYCGSGETLFLNHGGAFSGSFQVASVVEKPRNPIVSETVTAEIYGRNMPDIFSEKGRCALSNGWADATGFRWNGACNNNRASGPGMIEWTRGPEVIWRTRVGPNWGMALSDGVLRYDVDLNDFKFSLVSCDQASSGYRAVSVDTPRGTPEVYFENSWVVQELMGRGALFAQAECPVPAKGFENIVVTIQRDGAQVVRGRNYDRDTLTWREFYNPVQTAMQNTLRQQEQTRVANERQAAAQAKADALAAELQRRRAAIVARAEGFIATGRGSLDDLAAALEVDHIGTLDRLERGARLLLGPVNGLATVTHDGERRYQVKHVAVSPFARLEQEFRSQQDFSWQNWMETTQAAVPARTEVACLFKNVGDVPREVREVRTALISFSRGSNATLISLSCE